MDRDLIIEKLFDDTQSLRRVWKQYFVRVLGSEQLSLAQMSIIFHIKEHQPITGKSLSKLMQMSPSAVTQLVEGLDGMGFIDRTVDSRDRRILHISLSKAGVFKMKQLKEKRRQFFIEATQTLSDSEIAAMAAIQEKMILQIEAQLGDIHENFSKTTKKTDN